MSQKAIKNLVIFLVFNAILAIYILGSYLYKSYDEKKNTQVVKKEIPTVVKVSTPAIKPTVNSNGSVNKVIPTHSELASVPVESVKSLNEKTNPNLDTKLPIQPNIVAAAPKLQTNIETNKVCVEMGPFNAEEKSTMDFILAKNKQTELASVDKMQAHQLYWNLGKNKSDADKLFKKQKEGAMSDAKFVLIQNQDKDWIVNITKVHGSVDVAKKLVKDLEEKAQKINAGGTWQYTSLPEGYFYKFNDFKSLKEVTINSIDIMLKAPKDPC